MKQKKNAFTLIELLAVIVILAIIALIAVPVILNIIDKANKSAFKDTAYGIISAGEYYFTGKQLDLNGMENDEVFDLSETNELELKGEIPEGKVAVNTEGKVALAVTNGRYCITKGYNDKDVTVTENATSCELPVRVLKIGDSVYFNPVANAMCPDDYKPESSVTGVKTGCMRWYVYKLNGSNVGLILDHNTTGKVKWISEEAYGCGVDGSFCTKNDKGPITLMNQLKADTEDQGWQVKADVIDVMDIVKLIPYFTKLEDITTWESHWEDYRDAYDVALNDAVASIPQSNYSSVDEYIDATLDYAENKYPDLSLPRGLYRDMLYEGTMSQITGAELSTHGYWTKNASSLDTDCAWDVSSSGHLAWDNVSNDDNDGARPVINLSKSLIS